MRRNQIRRILGGLLRLLLCSDAPTTSCFPQKRIELRSRIACGGVLSVLLWAGYVLAAHWSLRGIV